jgi:hypothetical protein
MDKTAISAGAPPIANGKGAAIQALQPAVPTKRPARAPKPLPVRFLHVIADLRITVVLFALSLFLVFYGTLAQAEKGIWTVVGEYFRSLYVFIPMNVVLLKPMLRYQGSFEYGIPYPGGWLLGTLLMVNLVAAHIVSFKLTWKRSGILLIHGGIVLMMLGELITGVFAVESHMSIVEGQSTNFIERYDRPELAVVELSEVKNDRVTVVPTAILRRGGLIRNPDLPFDIDMVQYMVNSNLRMSKPDDPMRADRGQGLTFIAEARPEGVGVDPEQRVDLASAYVTLKRKGSDEPLAKLMLSTFPNIKPEWVAVDGKNYQVSLRFKRTYQDYTFRLDKLNVSYYPGTNVPKDYSSYIHLTDPTRGEGRDVRIWMNNPLSYAGATFYQASAQDRTPDQPGTTTLQVVSNPGWALPYLSCLLVAGGMLFHFGQNLVRFIERRAM